MIALCFHEGEVDKELSSPKLADAGANYGYYYYYYSTRNPAAAAAHVVVEASTTAAFLVVLVDAFFSE